MYQRRGSKYKSKEDSEFHIRTREFQTKLIRERYVKNNRNLAKTAGQLGISRRTAYDYLLDDRHDNVA